jgi:hypothetical protein
MGALCGCDSKRDPTTTNMMGLTFRDPRLIELQTHLKVMDAKQNSNMT